MTVYLASPFFNDKERAVKAIVKKHLVTLPDTKVCDPQNSNNPMSWEQHNAEWASKVFKKDVDRIEEADVVIAIDWGLYGDCGTAWEIAWAIAQKKVVVVVSPDECLAIPHSLMVVSSCYNFISVSRLLSLNEWADIFDMKYFLKGVEQK